MPALPTPSSDASGIGARRALVLSLPSFAFAGYELARKTLLPAWLVSQAGFGMAQAGATLVLLGSWAIAVEVLFGAVSHSAPASLPRRAFWITTGTVLQLAAGGVIVWQGDHVGQPVLVGSLLVLASGWVLANLTHGAWALEAASGVAARTKIFSWRGQAGIAGSIALSVLAMCTGRTGSATGPSAFVATLGVVTLLAPVAHGLLIWLVPEPPALPALRPHAGLVEPFRACLNGAGNRLLAMLFLCVGAYTAIFGAGLLFIARHAVQLPAWGATVITVQAVAAACGISIAGWGLRRAGGRVSPLTMLESIFAGNLLLALLLPTLPRGELWALLGWSAGCGATGAADFMLLRVLLGERLDRDRHRGRGGAAAAYYAGFHLPFNLGATIGVAALFRGWAWLGFASDAGAGAVVSAGTVLDWPAALLSVLAAAALVIARMLGQTRLAESAGNTAHSF